MDVSSTAQVISTVSAAVAQSQALTPVQLSMAAGLVMSHVINPQTDSVSDKMRPILAGGSAALSAAAVAYAQGTPASQALSYGVVSAASAYLSHFLFFKNGGALNVLKGAMQGLSAPAAKAVPMADHGSQQ